ncbi:unnamed protein product [Pleuronectes platessa]|uniref:Uncharacterized protein n=1 Tax=Pleuronectes platessa TaxID=8262 RepID=A0A9N7ZD72_PLEPL|nr:unnamed protein product [Pleuronectes platessa]
MHMLRPHVRCFIIAGNITPRLACHPGLRVTVLFLLTETVTDEPGSPLPLSQTTSEPAFDLLSLRCRPSLSCCFSPVEEKADKR